MLFLVSGTFCSQSVAICYTEENWISSFLFVGLESNLRGTECQKYIDRLSEEKKIWGDWLEFSFPSPVLWRFNQFFSLLFSVIFQVKNNKNIPNNITCNRFFVFLRLHSIDSWVQWKIVNTWKALWKKNLFKFRKMKISTFYELLKWNKKIVMGS